MVQIVNRPTVRTLILPTLFTVHALEEQLAVLICRHLDRRIAHPPVGTSPVHVRSGLSAANGNGNDLATTIHRNPLDHGKGGRIDSSEFGADLLNGTFAHILTDDMAFRRDAEQDLATLLVEHRTDCPRRLSARPGRGLELGRPRNRPLRPVPRCAQQSRLISTLLSPPVFR